MQVRHRLTTHGFALNVTNEPLKWFEQVIACGLDGVSASSIQSTTQKSNVKVVEEMENIVQAFGEAYQRPMQGISRDGEIWDAIQELEEVAAQAGSWPREPQLNV